VLNGFKHSAVFLLSFLFVAEHVVCTPPFPTFPTQFSARVEITAHLVDRSKPYPPWLKVINVKYDYDRQMAHAEVLQGFDEGKTFIRRYDNKTEYMIRGGTYPDCQRSYLSEDMPLPTMPKSLMFVKTEIMDGVLTDYWLQDLDTNRVHVYVRSHDGLPYRVTNEQVLEKEKESVPLMTYEWKDVVVDKPNEHDFELPSPYHWRSCSRYIGGYPYLHIFHTFFRF
jgi:hypothetical protein